MGVMARVTWGAMIGLVLISCDDSTAPPRDARVEGPRLDLEGNLDLGKQCVQSCQCKSTYCAQVLLRERVRRDAYEWLLAAPGEIAG